MRYGFRWVAAVFVLALMLPSAAGALPAAKVSFRSESWNPWSRIAALVSGILGALGGVAKPRPEVETGCGADGTGLPKCNS